MAKAAAFLLACRHQCIQTGRPRATATKANQPTMAEAAQPSKQGAAASLHGCVSACLKITIAGAAIPPLCNLHEAAPQVPLVRGNSHTKIPQTAVQTNTSKCRLSGGVRQYPGPPSLKHSRPGLPYIGRHNPPQKGKKSLLENLFFRRRAQDE